jgi:hypothetical protein
MTYTYYKVVDTNNNPVFECINDDIYDIVYYINEWWELRH